MGSKKNISKFLGAFVLVLALTFSTTSYAIGEKSNKKSEKSYKKSEKSEKSYKKSEKSEKSYKRSEKSYKRSEKNTKSVPIDGGLSVLLLGAAAFGVKKLRDNKK